MSIRFLADGRLPLRKLSGLAVCAEASYGFSFKRFPTDNELLIAGPYFLGQTSISVAQQILAIVLSSSLYGAL